MKFFCKCGKEMTTDKIGVNVIEMASFGPYKIWSTDRLICTNCGTTFYRSSDKPVAEHFETGFEDLFNAIKKTDHVVCYEWQYYSN